MVSLSSALSSSVSLSPSVTFSEKNWRLCSGDGVVLLHTLHILQVNVDTRLVSPLVEVPTEREEDKQHQTGGHNEKYHEYPHLHLSPALTHPLKQVFVYNLITLAEEQSTQLAACPCLYQLSVVKSCTLHFSPESQN